MPETCRAKNTLIRLPCCIKLAFHVISGCAEILLSGYRFEIHAEGLFVVEELLGYQRNWKGYLQKKMVNAFNVCHSVSGEKQESKLRWREYKLCSDLYSPAFKKI